MRVASERSDLIVVMAHTAARLLRDVYGITKEPVVIEHGMPAIEPHGRRRFKRQFGVEGRQIVSTFGLVDPRKGLEYVIEAMPEVIAAHPSTLYPNVGEAHPVRSRREAAPRAPRLRVRQADGLASHRTARPRPHARCPRRARFRDHPVRGTSVRETNGRDRDRATRAHMNIGRRIAENPLITARDVKPSMPEFEVVSVFNAATAVVNGEIVLLMRVAERPRTDVVPGPDALTLDLDQPHPILHPLPQRYRQRELIGMAFL